MHESLVTMRNEKVTGAMTKTYKAMTPDPCSLKIFEVSSTDYEKHLKGYDEGDIPLSLDVIGIAALRKMMSKLPAQGRSDVLRHHWQGNLVSLVGSLGSWSCQSATHRRLEIRKVLEKPQKV